MVASVIHLAEASPQMTGYRTRLSKDLDRWIARGLVPETSREPILAEAARARGMDASTALAAVGGLLLGAAVIAFVAANWAVIPRLGRFGLILGLFLAVGGGAAWAHARPIARNLSLLVAALVYAAAIGLTGQIFDIAGDPVAALHAAGLAAVVLALAGRSSAAAMVAVVFIGLGDFAAIDDHAAPWVAVAAPAGLALAWSWRSRPLAHVVGIALPIASVLTLVWLKVERPFWPLLGLTVAFTALAAVSRRLDGEGVWPTLSGWAVCAALIFLAVSGADEGPGLPPVYLQRAAWLAAGAGVIALGMHDRRTEMTAAGVLAIGAAIATILFDLGLGLMAASGVFALVAVAAVGAGWALRRARA